jgi:hypothetical protein
MRDGYTCVITGDLDFSKPDQQDSDRDSEDNIFVTLEACHILRRALAEFGKPKSRSVSGHS